jgi:hypothetical protein
MTELANNELGGVQIMFSDAENIRLDFLGEVA